MTSEKRAEERLVRPLKTAVLVDLPRTPSSGGHVKCWERLANAAAESDLPLDLTVYFSGEERTEILGEKARIRHLPPVFSTERLKFLPYVPDHTDLAPFHPKLAKEIESCDVIHTTDGFFAFAGTAERLKTKKGVPLVTSFHTDTPSYARIFTRQTIEKMFGSELIKGLLLQKLRLPERQENKMCEKLRRHVGKCGYAMVTRKEDHLFAENILGAKRVSHLRLGIDKKMFGPHRRSREALEQDYNIEKDSVVVLFVGRLDVGKNVYTLIESVKNLLSEGMKIHVLTAGIGPAADDIRKILGKRATVAGFVQPDELARLYASVDILALTSEVEIRSMAGVEAMTSGCPVLVSRKSGVAELFNNTPAMRVVDGGVDNWTKALKETASSPALREQMRKEALKHCETHITGWDEVLKEDLFKIWDKAAAER